MKKYLHPKIIITALLLTGCPFSIAQAQSINSNEFMTPNLNHYQTNSNDLEGFSRQMQSHAQSKFKLAGLKIIGGNKSQILNSEGIGKTEIAFSRMLVEFKGIPLAVGSEVISMSGPSETIQQHRKIPENIDGERPVVDETTAQNFAISKFQQEYQSDGMIKSTKIEVWSDRKHNGFLTWSIEIRGGTKDKPIAKQYWVSAITKNRLIHKNDLIHTTDIFFKTNIWSHGDNFAIEKNVGLPYLKVWADNKDGSHTRTYTFSDGELIILGDEDEVSSLRSRMKGSLANVEDISQKPIEMDIPFDSSKSTLDIYFGPKSDNDENGLAQSSAYYWTTLGQLQYSGTAMYDTERPNMLLRGLQIYTNINNGFGCNAFWDGYSINFMASSKTCNNTATPSVILHELGHGFDTQAGGISDGAYSEGFGDAMAVLILQDSCLGKDFFKDSSLYGKCLRDASEKIMWPPEDEEVHAAGRVYAGFAWQLAQELIKTQSSEDKAYAIARRLVFNANHWNPYDIPWAVWNVALVDYILDEDRKGVYYNEIAAAAKTLNLPVPDPLGEEESNTKTSLAPSPPAITTPAPTSIGTIAIGGDIDNSDIGGNSGGAISIIE